MSKIYFTSDLHFCHNKEFLYQGRGFDNIQDMNSAIVTNWNNTIEDDDEVYVLGDLFLNDNEKGLELVKSLKGRLHVVFGNHDTDNRRELIQMLPSVVEWGDALRLKYKGYHFFVTHYPCFTGDCANKKLKECTCNIFGHTHQEDNFFKNIPNMYHCGVDSHNCTPISLDDIIDDMELRHTIGCSDIGMMNVGDISTLACCAIRYCFGRQTYMPSTIQEIIMRNINLIDNKTIYTIERDVRERIQDHDAGLISIGDPQIDYPDWVKFYDGIKIEFDKRFPNGHF